MANFIKKELELSTASSIKVENKNIYFYSS